MDENGTINDTEPETKTTPTETYVLQRTYLIDTAIVFGLIGLNFAFTLGLFLCSLRRVRASELSRVYPAVEDAIVSRVISMLPPDNDEVETQVDERAFSPPTPPPPEPPVDLPPEPSPRIPLTDRTHTPPAVPIPPMSPPEPPASPVPSVSSTSIVPEEEVASQTSSTREIVLQTFTFSVSGRKEPITVRLVQDLAQEA